MPQELIFSKPHSHSAHMLQPTMGQREEEIRQDAGYKALSALLK